MTTDIILYDDWIRWKTNNYKYPWDGACQYVSSDMQELLDRIQTQFNRPSLSLISPKPIRVPELDTPTKEFFNKWKELIDENKCECEDLGLMDILFVETPKEENVDPNVTFRYGYGSIDLNQLYDSMTKDPTDINVNVTVAESLNAPASLLESVTEENSSASVVERWKAFKEALNKKE